MKDDFPEINDPFIHSEYSSSNEPYARYVLPIEGPDQRTSDRWRSRVAKLLLQSDSSPGIVEPVLGVQADSSCELEDLTGTTDLLDVESAAACNINSKRLRVNATGLLEPETKNTLDLPPAVIRDVVVDGDEISIGKPRLRRRVFGLNNTNMFEEFEDTKFVIWTETDKRTGIFSGRVDLDEDDIDGNPIKFGLAVKSKLSPDEIIFVPIIMSIQTSEGCNVTMPNGAELDSTLYDKSTIIRKLLHATKTLGEICSYESHLDIGFFGKVFSEDVGGYNRRGTETAISEGSEELRKTVNELIACIGQTVQGNTEVTALNTLLVDLMEDEARSPVRKEIESDLRKLSRVNPMQLRFATADEMPVQVNAVHITEPEEKRMANDTVQIQFIVADDGVRTGNNSAIRSRQWTIWGGNDLIEYGTKRHPATQFPRYRLAIDELDRLRLYAFRDTLDEVEIASPAQESLILEILNSNFDVRYSVRS